MLLINDPDPDDPASGLPNMEVFACDDFSVGSLPNAPVVFGTAVFSDLPKTDVVVVPNAGLPNADAAVGCPNGADGFARLYKWYQAECQMQML